jgi:putative sporulation protein YtxC
LPEILKEWERGPSILMITISTLNSEMEVKENLVQELNFLNREGIQVKLVEQESGKIISWDCSVTESGDQDIRAAHEQILRYYLANIITELLMNGITKEFMNRLVKNKYHHLSHADLKAIVQNAYSHLNNLHEAGDISKTLFRHNQILTLVNEYLNGNSQLFLEGFLRFRLKNYFRELKEAVERAVENYVVEQEYHEFIRLLQYFVEMQEPKIEEVHILIRDKQSIYILDEDRKPINPEQLKGVLIELNPDIDYEDLLLSALITVAPLRLILHIITPIEIIETITSVFRERVTFCGGCSLCRNEAQIPELFLPTWLRPES